MNENTKDIEEAIENISRIHYQLLLHDELDVSILEIIADSPDEWIRASIANHPNVTLNILNKLSTDPDEDVRRCVAESEKINLEIIELLLNDSSEIVRTAISNNPLKSSSL